MPHLPKWSENLSVENRLIDDQHRQLIEMCNRVADFTSAASPSAVEKYHRLLAELMRMVDEHFIAEEVALARNHCPTFSEHKAEHDAYREHLDNLINAGRSGELQPANLYKLANDYLIRHMEVSDLACKQYLQSSD